MKKGFTLIELLAVIVILAIIALIATPIILGIINDARKESNERSVELYASAVRNAIASYQLTNPNAPASFSDLTIEHDGEVVCETEELYADGSFYIANCTVNGTLVEGYTYGEPQETPSTQVYKPQYYSWSSGTVGGTLPSDAKSTVAELNPSYPFYLGLDVEDGVVSAVYACFTRNNTEYCLKGYDTEAYETNKTVLEDAFADVLDDACSFADGRSDCRADGVDAYAYSYGSAGAYDYNGYCNVYDDGNFGCTEY